MKECRPAAGSGPCFPANPNNPTGEVRNKEDLKASMAHNLDFLNTHPFLVTFVMGIVLSLEQNKADTQTIRSVRISAASPLGGIGDALFWMTLIPIVAGMTAQMAMDRSWIGPILYFIIAFGVEMALRYGLMYWSYGLGTKAVTMLTSNAKEFTRAASILGIFVVGALIANYGSTTLRLIVGETQINVQGLLDGVAFKGGTAKDQSVQLGSGRMIPGFEDGILGHKAGDEFEINVTFPKNYPNKELAGKPVVFKIKLHDVCVRQLPALNSDFAKKMGKETMEEYRAFVKQQLFDGRHGGALNHAKDMILGQLADAAEGEIPSILVENAYQQQMQVIQQQLQMQRMSLNTYLSQIHETRESFTAKVRAAAEKNTRARMALLQIAQQENLLPTDEEIDKQLAERAEKTKKTVEEIKASTDVAALRRNEGIRKAADWVIDHSTIEEKVESK